MILQDPAGWFKASLGGNAMRAIDLHEGAELDADACEQLGRAAVDLTMGDGEER